MTNVPRMERLVAALATASAIACSTSSGSHLPSLSDYTDGAAVAVEAGARLFDGTPASAELDSPKNRPLREAARAWSSACASGCRAEASIVDFPRRPGASAIARLRMKLEGFGPNGERVFADERFDLDLRRRENGWTLAGSVEVAGSEPI